jgi:hypothetical protein
MLSKRIDFSSVTWRCKGLEMRNATRNAMVGRSWNIFGKLDAAGFSFLFSRGYHPMTILPFVYMGNHDQPGNLVVYTWYTPYFSGKAQGVFWTCLSGPHPKSQPRPSMAPAVSCEATTPLGLQRPLA